VALEVVKEVVFLRELGVVAFDCEQPRPSEPVDLEAELEQVAKSAQRDVFVL